MVGQRLTALSRTDAQSTESNDHSVKKMTIRLDQFSNSDFDRGANRLKEKLWVACKCLFFLPSWPLPSAFRVGLLRLFGARIGKHVVIRSRVNITFPWRLSLGDHVWVGEEVLILSLAAVRIRSHVCISQRAFLCTGSHDFGSEGFDLITGPITIESHSWIASQASIGPDVHVGPRSVAAAGAVVVRDVPPDSLVVGSPGVVRNRGARSRTAA